jgi:hypothetical protein
MLSSWLQRCSGIGNKIWKFSQIETKSLSRARMQFELNARLQLEADICGSIDSSSSTAIISYRI